MDFSSAAFLRKCSRCRRGRQGLLFLLHLFQVEIDHGGIAKLCLDVVHRVHVFAVDFESKLVSPERKTGVEVVALFVALDLIVASDVFAIDLDQSALKRCAVVTFYITFKR